MLAELASLDVEPSSVAATSSPGHFRRSASTGSSVSTPFRARERRRESPRAPAGLWDWIAAQLDPALARDLASWPHPVSLDGVLYCHGSPRDLDEILTKVSPEERFRAALAGVEERVVVGGHTHVQFERESTGSASSTPAASAYLTRVARARSGR